MKMGTCYLIYMKLVMTVLLYKKTNYKTQKVKEAMQFSIKH